MNSSPTDSALAAVGKAYSYAATFKLLRRVTVFVKPNLTVVLTRQGRPDGRDRQATWLLTIGTPNFRNRARIKEMLAAKEPFPVKKALLEYWPTKH